MDSVAILIGCGLFVVSFGIVQFSVRRVDKKLDQVHVLVNSKMTAALEKIENLEAEVARQKNQLNHDA